jgi:hypothetical protein
VGNWDLFASIEFTTGSLLFFPPKRSRAITLLYSKPQNPRPKNASSARRKMWGEDGNDARFIKLN